MKTNCPLAKDIDDAIAEELSEDAVPAASKKNGKGKKHITLTLVRDFERRAILSAEAKALPIYSEWLVVLDTAANVNGLCNRELCKSIKPNEDFDEEISGFNGSNMVPKFEAVMKELELDVKYDPDFMANIVSFAALEDAGYQITYIPWLHQFEVNTGSKQFVFERYNNVFVCDFSPAAMERLHAFISTVDENERLFPAAEVKSAKGVQN